MFKNFFKIFAEKNSRWNLGKNLAEIFEEFPFVFLSVNLERFYLGGQQKIQIQKTNIRQKKDKTKKRQDKNNSKTK